MTISDEAHAEALGRYVEGHFTYSRSEEAFAEWKVGAFVAGAEWQASRPITDERVAAAAETLIARHWDGTGCGTHGANACANCFGPSPMSAYEVARVVLEAARGVQS